jgi:meso-butanediol dehydrogenase/(S,S)-butanediol dehydrogenase/diacetyl reductase
MSRTALITGAAGVIGRAICQALAADGHHVVAADLDEDSVRSVAKQIQGDEGSAEAHRLDVTDREAFAALVDDIVARHGRIDQLWNVAGTIHVDQLVDLPEHTWRHVFDVNLHGTFFGAQAALRHMLTQEPDPDLGLRGRIVNTGSGAASVGRPRLAAYGASKAAVRHLTMSIAAAHGGDGVCAVALYPGTVEGPMMTYVDRRHTQLDDMRPGAYLEERRARSATGHLTDPAVVGEAARRLASTPGMELSGKIVRPRPGGFVIADQ